MIEAMRNTGGAPHANAFCDDPGCKRVETVACGYHRLPTGAHVPDDAQVRKKLTAQGWSYVRGKLRCPSCEAKRKVEKMEEAKKKPLVVVDNSPPVMTPREKIEIFKMLAEVYDLDAGRYSKSDTDETVADVLGVRVGFVTQVREADFGPDGGNEDIEALMERLEAFGKQVQAILESAAQQHEAAEKKLAEGSAMRAELERIKKAVGPRALKAAKA